MEDPAFKNDCCDAALYAWREALHWIQVNKVPKPEVGTDEYYAQQADNLRRKRMAAMKRRK